MGEAIDDLLAAWVWETEVISELGVAAGRLRFLRENEAGFSLLPKVFISECSHSLNFCFSGS